MSMPLLPDWLRAVWVVALCGVLLVHLGHARSMPGMPRWWHVGHIAMAGGMIAMYLVPQDHHPQLYWAGVAGYGALCLAAAWVAAHVWIVDERSDWAWVWTASTIGMGAMTYMALPAADQTALPTYLLVTYLCVEILLWLVLPQPCIETAVGPTDAGGGLATAVRTKRRAGADLAVGVRVTLVVMSAAMIWMLVAMQTMTTAMPSGPMHM